MKLSPSSVMTAATYMLVLAILPLHRVSGVVEGAVEDSASNARMSGKTVYIRDTLYVSLRAGQSARYPVLQRSLRSGTKLQQFEENSETGYSLVRTEDGMEGWIQTQYLSDKPIAADQLARLKAQLEELQAQHQEALRHLRESGAELATTQKEAAEQIETLTNELNRATELAPKEPEKWHNDLAQEWLLMGAGVVLTSLLCGFWVARRIYNRRNDGWA